MRRGATLIALVVSLLAACSAVAGPPPGPRLAYVQATPAPLRLELRSIDPSGGHILRIAGGTKGSRPLPLPLKPPSWSADGSRIAFEGTVGQIGGEGQATRHQVYVSPAGGGSPTAVPGTVGGSRPVFSPDGQTIAFDRERIRSRKTRGGRQVTVYQSVSVWLADLATGRSRRLTAWHNGLSTVADSFSPDGSTLSVTRQKGTGSAPEVVLMKIDGSGSSVLAVEAEDGVYSPDGSQIAYLNLREHSVSGHRGGHAFVRVEQTTDLFTTRVDGTDTRQLTNTPGSIEAWPSWDPSGKRLAFTRLRGGSLNGLLGVGDAIAEVNADGTCATTVLSVRGASLFGAAWQPGPGREAGPIVC